MAENPHRSKKSHPQRHGSMGSHSGQGKGGGKQHQKKKTPKKPLKQNAYAVTMKNLVPSEVTTTSGGEREKCIIKDGPFRTGGGRYIQQVFLLCSSQ